MKRFRKNKMPVNDTFTHTRGKSRQRYTLQPPSNSNHIFSSAFAGGPFNQSTVFHPNTPNEVKSQLFMGFSVTFLGTGSGNPNLWRNCAGQAVKFGGRTILVDAGEGTQLQIMKSKGVIKPQDIDTILITHMHADHVLGLPGLLFNLDQCAQMIKSSNRKIKHDKLKSLARKNGLDPRVVGYQRKGSKRGEYDVEWDDEPKVINIVGPPGLHNFVRSAACMTMASLRNLDVRVKELWGGKYDAGMGRKDNVNNPFMNSAPQFKHSRISLEKIYKEEDGTWLIEDKKKSTKKEIKDMLDNTKNDRERREVIVRERGSHTGANRPLIVKAGEVWHVNKVATFGYSIKEDDPLPRINPERAKSLGLKPGAEYDLLKIGLEVETEGGKKISLSDCALEDEEPKGRHLVIIGDCRAVSKGMGSLVEGCDVLVHEATLGDTSIDLALSRGHSTPYVAATLAAKAKVARHLILTHFSQSFIGMWGEESVLHAKHSHKGRSVVEKYNERVGGELEMLHACDLMEVYLKKKTTRLKRWEDGIGNDYVDMTEEREREREEEEEEITKKIMDAVGWEFDGRGNIRMQRGQNNR